MLSKSRLRLMELAKIRPVNVTSSRRATLSGFSLQRRGTRQDPRNRLSLVFLSWDKGPPPKGVPHRETFQRRKRLVGMLWMRMRHMQESFGSGLSISTVNALTTELHRIVVGTFLVVGCPTIGNSHAPPSYQRQNIPSGRYGDLPSPPADGSCSSRT